MVGLVVVSHSERAAEGIVEVAAEMAGTTRIEPVGGDGRAGSAPSRTRSKTRSTPPTTARGSSSSSIWVAP